METKIEPSYSLMGQSLYVGEAIETLAALPEKSVHMCVTSPPYFGLRSYLDKDHPAKGREIGTEKTPQEFVEKLVAVFGAVWRVLRDDGTLWVNIGDSYASGGNGIGSGKQLTNVGSWMPSKKPSPGLKPKDLCMIPARFAIAMQEAGWYLRSEIVWAKPNPMPESVTDRPTSAHEKVYLFSKRPRYFYDAEAVKEQAAHAGKSVKLGAKSFSKGQAAGAGVDPSGNGLSDTYEVPPGRNLRNVWTISTKPYAGSHFATFPPELPMRCIRAGTSERGVCEACGAPWRRVVERTGDAVNSREGVQQAHRSHGAQTGGTQRVTLGVTQHITTQTVGWQPTCTCDAEAIPATVLDPFAGSGTAALASLNLGRRSIGIDIDERSVDHMQDRLTAKKPKTSKRKKFNEAQGSLFS